jgi:Ca2+-transporting ATPase
MELIIDPVCSVVFESEREEKNIMNRKPRPANEAFFGAKKIAFSIFQGTLLFLLVLAVYFHSIMDGHPEGEVRAIAFSSLIIGNVFLILANLSKSRSFVSVLSEKNISIKIMLPAVAVMLFSILTVPVLQTTFGFHFPGYVHFIPSLIGASIMLLVLEVIKYVQYKRFGARK